MRNFRKLLAFNCEDRTYWENAYELRKYLGYSQKKLGQILKTSQSTVHRYETLDAIPPLSYFAKLALLIVERDRHIHAIEDEKELESYLDDLKGFLRFQLAACSMKHMNPIRFGNWNDVIDCATKDDKEDQPKEPSKLQEPDLSQAPASEFQRKQQPSLIELTYPEESTHPNVVNLQTSVSDIPAPAPISTEVPIRRKRTSILKNTRNVLLAVLLLLVAYICISIIFAPSWPGVANARYLAEDEAKRLNCMGVIDSEPGSTTLKVWLNTCRAAALAALLDRNVTNAEIIGFLELVPRPFPWRGITPDEMANLIRLKRVDVWRYSNSPTGLQLKFKFPWQPLQFFKGQDLLLDPQFP